LLAQIAADLDAGIARRREVAGNDGFPLTETAADIDNASNRLPEIL
jgi:hypothetical protein